MNDNSFSLQSISKSADILAQAPNLFYIDTFTIRDYSSYYDYFYDVSTTEGTVYVRQAGDPSQTIIYQTKTSKTKQSFCDVTIYPCNSGKG